MVNNTAKTHLFFEVVRIFPVPLSGQKKVNYHQQPDLWLKMH